MFKGRFIHYIVLLHSLIEGDSNLKLWDAFYSLYEVVQIRLSANH